MSPVAEIGFWAALFLITHLGISSTRLRPHLVGAIGEPAYRAFYSIVSFATFIPLALVFAYHKHAGPMLWNLRSEEAVRWLAWILLLAAFVLLIAGLASPNPAALGAPAGRERASGILKLTRHPAFVAFSLFGLAHMMTNGWVGDLIFFGTFPVVGILGAIHQDHRKLIEIGDSYRTFMDSTSIVPGAALLEGRLRWERGDTQWGAIAIGVVLTVVVLLIHPMVFGGHPLG